MIKHTAQTLNAPVVHLELGNPLQRVIATVLAWQQRYELRRHLLEMDDHLLDDIGLSPVEARQEGAKPFWRA